MCPHGHSVDASLTASYVPSLHIGHSGRRVVGRGWNQYWEQKTFLENIQLVSLSSVVYHRVILPARMSGEASDF